MIEVPRQEISIIFDLDGTLVGSEKTWMKASRQFFDELGHGDQADKINPKLVGLTERDAMNLIIDELELHIQPDKLSERRLDIVRNLHATESLLFDGVFDLLSELEAAGFKTAIGTSSDRSTAEYLVSLHNLRPLFDAVVTANDVKMGKPHPETFLTAAKHLCTDAENCIVIEDSPRGLEAARAAGMKAIAVKHDGIFSDEELLSKNPIRIIDEIGQLSVEDFLNA